MKTEKNKSDSINKESNVKKMSDKFIDYIEKNIHKFKNKEEYLKFIKYNEDRMKDYFVGFDSWYGYENIAARKISSKWFEKIRLNTPHKLLLWGRVNVSANKFVEQAKESQKIKFKFEYIDAKDKKQYLELNCQDSSLNINDDYKLIIHSDKGNYKNIDAINKALKEGSLWKNFSFISSSLIGPQTGTYATSSDANSKIPFSFIMEVDPKAIIHTANIDINSPQLPSGSKLESSNLEFVYNKIKEMVLSDALESEYKKANKYTKYSSVDKNIELYLKNKIKPILTPLELLKITEDYNELIILSGDVSKSFTGNEIKIKAIMLEDESIKRFRKIFSRHKKDIEHSFFKGDIETIKALNKLSKDHNIPIIYRKRQKVENKTILKNKF